MVDGVNGKIRIGGTDLNIDLSKLKGIKVNDNNCSIFTGKLDINKDGKVNADDKIDINDNKIIDDDKEVNLLKRFLVNAAGENKTIDTSSFEGAEESVITKFMNSLKDIATQQTQNNKEEETTGPEQDSADTQSTTKMTVKSGCGNTQIAKEALKAQGIENPTAEQIQKAKAAIEEANADQCKTWKAKYGSQLPEGTKYFYANAEINIPDLKKVLAAAPSETEVDDGAKSSEEETPPTPAQNDSEEMKMTVQSGWGNTRVAKEALKAQGIENPTAEQIQKAKEAIEEANADQCKTWKAKYGSQIPEGTKYFYANAEIKIPNLKEVLGISSTEVKPTEEVEPTVNPPQQEDTPTETDCIIQNPSKQSKKTNDCWLLSGTNSLINTSWGRKALNEAVQKGENGGYTITLKGADNKKIEVSQKEIAEAKSSGLYAEGDDSLIALEIAINKYREELHPQSETDREINGLAINWGEGYELLHLITGKPVSRVSHNALEQNPDYVKQGKLDVEKALDKMKENPDEIAMVASFMNSSNPLEKMVIDGVEISPKHAYAVVGVKIGDDGKEYVILINPRNSGEKIKISKEAFLKHIDAVDAIANNEDSLENKELPKIYPIE